jgi:shikimate dehydrogenase
VLSVGEGGIEMPRRLAVLGKPISHSRSPAIHNAAFAALGISEKWSYEAIEVAPEDFESRVRAMPGEGFVGANVTVPHKGAALQIADQRSEVAREVGAANTLSFDDGTVRADNTDAGGLLAALPGSTAGKRALVLGAGGAGRAAVWALRREGAEVHIWNRTAERAAALATDLGGLALHAGDERLATGDFDLIVNATSVGLRGEDAFAELPLQRDSLHGEQTLVDFVYGDAETALVSAARTAGAEVVDGLEVLVRQGAASFRIWTGQEPPLDAMREAARAG